jgi:hypothetical protein
MNQTFAAAVAISVLAFANLRAQDAKFVADNLKYSRDFYSKVHFVTMAKLPAPFKYNRYPSNGPERIQSDDGSYTRQSGTNWVHSEDRGRAGLPINFAENDRYFMTFAAKDEWGRRGEPVKDETARKLENWIKLINGAFNLAPANVKLIDKSESEGRAQWIFESPPLSANGIPTRFTFRKPVSDKNENVLLHEFSGSFRVEAGKVFPSGAADPVKFGFGYMMKADDVHEVSERVWEEMQQASAEKSTKKP